MSNIRPWFRLSSIARPTSQGSSDPPPPPPQPQPRQTPRRPVIIRTPGKQTSPPRQRQPPPRQQQRSPSPPRQRQPPPSTRQQQRSPSPPRQRQPPPPTRQQQRSPSPPRQRQPPPSTRQQQQPPPSPPREKTPPPPPPPRYHSPPSRHMSPPTPPKAVTPALLPPRSFYTPPATPKEVQEAFPPSPAHSTRSIKSEWETPRKASSPHEVLSPYSLPPARLHSDERETTQKNILTAEKTSHLHEPNHHNTSNHSQNNNHQGNNTKKSHHQPHFSESENIMGARVITIAGENKGAVMEILRSPRSNKTGSGSRTHSSKVFNGTGEKGRKLQSSSSSSDEGEAGKNNKTTKNSNNISNNGNLPMKAFMNSNVQMLNNSIVYNSTSIHHDPGVHLKITRKTGSDNDLHVKDYGNNGGYTN